MIGPAIAGFLAPSLARSGQLLTVESSKDGARIQVTPSRPGSDGLLELVEDRSGRCVRTLWAGSLGSKKTIPLGKEAKLPAGTYRVRYREGLGLAPDSALTLPGSVKWSNPTDLVLTEKAIYVYEQGLGEPSKEGEEPKAMSSGTNVPYIHKFNKDGTPDARFADRGRLGPLPSAPYWPAHAIRSFGVDEAGCVYVGSGYHEVLVFDPSGDKTPVKIGGYAAEGPDAGSVTMNVNSIVCGPNHRIYLPGMFGDLMVYDRTKEGLEGFLYKATLASTRPGLHRCVATDGEGGVYAIDHASTLQKFRDTGKALLPAYAADPSDKLSFPTGPSASGGLLWVAAHGGPPTWDSDGGEVVLFWDNQESLQRVARFGKPGKAPDKVQFMNPSAAVQTPDHLALWVVEDGMPNAEGPPGNARVRKFTISSTKSEEAPLEWRGEGNP